jgi:hypothetical protein
VQSLTAAVDALAAQVPADLPPQVALGSTVELMRQYERLGALVLQRLSDVDTRKLHALQDAPTLSSWVTRQHVPAVGATQVTLARRLRSVSHIAAALAEGRLGAAAAGQLARTVATARPHLDRGDGLIDGRPAEPVLYGVLVDGICSQVAEQIGTAPDAAARLAGLRAELEQLNDPARSHCERLDAALVVLARESDPALLTSALGLLLDALLPEQHGKRAAQAEDDARLTLTGRADGSGGRVVADLDAETFELMQVALSAAAATDPQAAQDTAAWASGRAAVPDDTLGPQDWPAAQPRPRSRAQQRHEALRRALRALLDSGALGVRGKTAPHVVVITDLDFVHDVPGSLPARTEHGGRLSREQVRRLLCRSRFTRMVLDARRRVVEVSHTQRTSTALERLILKVQGGATCSGSGCARGPATGHRLIPHHATLFSDTGTTELDDTILLCEIEHDHELHGKGKALQLKDGRVPGPDGWLRR